MSEPNWRELGDPWADRLPPRPRTKPVDPVIAWVGDVAVIHGERDDSEMCLCGAPDYLTCPDWIAGNGTVSSLTFTSATCYYSLGHRNRHQCDCVCATGRPRRAAPVLGRSGAAMSTYRLDTGSVADWQITQRLGGNCVRIESPTLQTNMIVRLSDLIATGVPSGPVAGGGGQVEATPSAGALPAAIVPAARATDPATSHEAAATITVQRMRADHQLVLAALHDHGPMTDFGIAAKVSAALGRMVKATSLGVRRKELVTLGLVRNSGRRAPSDTGTSSIVWALTAAGDAEIRGVA